MIKRKIASDAPHVRKAKEVMLNRINQINLYPEFLRPTAMETQLEAFEMAIDQLYPDNFEYNEIRSKIYSEWSDGEIADFRDNFLAGEAIPKLKAMMEGGQEDLRYSDPRFNEKGENVASNLMSLSREGGASFNLKPALEMIVDYLYKDNYNDPFVFYMVERFLLAITRERNLRYMAYMMMLDLFIYIAGESAELGLTDYFADMERELNDEGRSFFKENKKKLSSKSFNGLISLSNHLDARGYSKEANQLDLIIRKLARKES